MASTSDVISSSQIQTSEHKNYPLNSFSGEETSLKVSALVLAFLCLSGAVAMAMGGQYVLPEIIMAPIPQIIIESTLGLAAIGLLIEVIIFSVKTESTLNNQQPDPNIDRAKLAFLDVLSEQNEQAQVTIEKLQATIQQLEQSGAKPEEPRQALQALVQKIDEMENSIAEKTAEAATLNTEKVQFLSQLTKAQKDLDEAKATLDKANEGLKAHISSLDASNQAHIKEKEQLRSQQAEAQKSFDETKATLDKANEGLKAHISSLEASNQAHVKEKEQLRSQQAEAQKSFDETKATLDKANEGLKAHISSLEASNQAHVKEKEQLRSQQAEAQKSFDEAKATLDKTNKDLEARISSLEASNQVHIQEKEQTAQAQIKICELQAQVEELRKECKARNNELEAYKKENNGTGEAEPKQVVYSRGGALHRTPTMQQGIDKAPSKFINDLVVKAAKYKYGNNQCDIRDLKLNVSKELLGSNGVLYSLLKDQVDLFIETAQTASSHTKLKEYSEEAKKFLDSLCRSGVELETLFADVQGATADEDSSDDSWG